MASGQPHTPILQYAVKQSPLPLNKWQSGPQIDLDTVERNLSPSSSLETNHNVSDIQPVAE